MKSVGRAGVVEKLFQRKFGFDVPRVETSDRWERGKRKRRRTRSKPPLQDERIPRKGTGREKYLIGADREIAQAIGSAINLVGPVRDIWLENEEEGDGIWSATRTKVVQLFPHKRSRSGGEVYAPWYMVLPGKMREEDVEVKSITSGKRKVSAIWRGEEGKKKKMEVSISFLQMVDGVCHEICEKYWVDQEKRGTPDLVRKYSVTSSNWMFGHVVLPFGQVELDGQARSVLILSKSPTVHDSLEQSEIKVVGEVLSRQPTPRRPRKRSGFDKYRLKAYGVASKPELSDEGERFMWSHLGGDLRLGIKVKRRRDQVDMTYKVMDVLPGQRFASGIMLLYLGMSRDLGKRRRKGRNPGYVISVLAQNERGLFRRHYGYNAQDGVYDYEDVGVSIEDGEIARRVMAKIQTREELPDWIDTPELFVRMVAVMGGWSKQSFTDMSLWREFVGSTLNGDTRDDDDRRFSI